MFDKYFGFLKSGDEVSIIQSLLEHVQIDSEELHILSTMVNVLINEDTGDLDAFHEQIKSINHENVKTFETVTDHIIQSNFDFQKQYDLLRLHQRIDNISALISATSNRIIILKNISGTVPLELNQYIKRLMKLVIDSQDIFIQAIKKFQISRKDVLRLIHKAEDYENMVDNARSESLQVLFQLANDGRVKMGNLHALEGIIENLENISDAVKSATTSLDWLLLN
jgi:uncharacterized protein Yka (UPF0111/DUF47 family)